MTEDIATQIETAEAQLRLTMLVSDVESLDALISPSLIFTTHFGSVISKQDDIRFSRVWQRSTNDAWQVVAGQATVQA